jgi:hypothetical protein
VVHAVPHPLWDSLSENQRITLTATGDGAAAHAAPGAEEILDSFQRDLMKDERVQPLTRATSRIHVGRGGAAHAVRARGDRAPQFSG